MIIKLLLEMIIMIFGFIAGIVGNLLPDLPVEITNVLDLFFAGLASATSWVVMMFDINLLKVLFTFWLLVWGLTHVIQFIVWLIFGRAKTE